MRWFVEVSRVGDSTPGEHYCVEAKAWQSALQETRKLRGDAGPLSKFSIELLDDGYRAVDPIQKIRYLVNQAPADAPLVAPPARNGSAHAAASFNSTAPAAPSRPPVGDSYPPAAIASRPPAAASYPPAVFPFPSARAASAAAVSAPSTAVSRTSSAAPVGAARPASSSDVATRAAVMPGIASTAPSAIASAAPAAASGGVNGVAQSAAAATLAPRPTPRKAGVPSTPTPSPAAEVAALPSRAPAEALSDNSKTAPAIAAAAEAVLRPLAVVSAVNGPAAARMLAAEPTFEILLSRDQAPTPDAPITYREVAYAVAPETPRAGVELLLRSRLDAMKAELAGEPLGQLVQLAVFDHFFRERPERPPLGTLIWKDWRGEPILSFPGFSSQAPPRITQPPTSVSIDRVAEIAVSAQPVVAVENKTSSAVQPAPAELATVETSEASEAKDAGTRAAAAESVTADPVEKMASESGAAEQQAKPASESVTREQEPAGAQAESVAGKTEDGSSAVSTAEEQPIPLRRPSSSSPGIRGSRPRIAAPRRRAGEDLISELFDLMHELHFATGIMDGADFLMGVLDEVLPSEVVLLQVFDINTRNFVVVRARGGRSREALTRRTPDTEALTAEVMRRGQPWVYVPEHDRRFSSGRWSFAGVPLKQVLCGPVRQGGRYLGMIELANPLGEQPFHDTEVNAVDYICRQFAEFVASRPLVLDDDVILGH